MATVMIGSARKDEYGKYSGGKAGDQTGVEVSTQNYYMHSKGWYVIRPKDINVANILASAMLSACNNSHIGYCQGHRTDLITTIKKYGTLAKVAVNTECDCSSLVRACCIEAGFDPGNFTTYDEAAKLAKTGKFEDKVAVTSSTVLYNGDILVTKTKGHTAIVVSGNPRTAKATTATKSTTKTVTGTVTAKRGLNVRASASTTAAKLYAIPYGSQVTIVGENNGWYQVNVSGRQDGWCSGQYIAKN